MEFCVVVISNSLVSISTEGIVVGKFIITGFAKSDSFGLTSV